MFRTIFALFEENCIFICFWWSLKFIKLLLEPILDDMWLMSVSLTTLYTKPEYCFLWWGFILFMSSCYVISWAVFREFIAGWFSLPCFVIAKNNRIDWTFLNLISPSIYKVCSFYVRGALSLKFLLTHGWANAYATLYLSEIPLARSLIKRDWAIALISYF